MGCSLAFYLSRAGRHVTVIDRGRIGQGATAACAGGIRAQFSTAINIRIGMEAKRLLAGPNEVTYGFANAARRQGAVILEDTPVEAFLMSGGTVRGVRAAVGEIESKETVICAGPWSAPLGDMLGLAVPIVPSRRQVFVT